jgi:hypothetical protein
MNELLLIDMMGELNPELFEDNYIEKDMKRGIKSFFKYVFPFKSKKAYEFPLEHSLTDETSNTEANITNDSQRKEDIELVDAIQVNEISEFEQYENNNRGFSISIFEKKFRNLIKIASGIAATFIVVIGIVLIIIRRHKSGIKTFEKNVQIIY